MPSASSHARRAPSKSPRWKASAPSPFSDAALVARLAEEVEAALELAERARQLPLLAVDAPHLVEGHRRLGARGHHPREAQHPLEGAQRRLVVAAELVHRAEVVPEVDAAG